MLSRPSPSATRTTRSIELAFVFSNRDMMTFPESGRLGPDSCRLRAKRTREGSRIQIGDSDSNLIMKRDFDAAAKTWDADDARSRMALAIADAMLPVLALSGSETLLDYGTGTGAVALRLAPSARQVIAAGSSRGMLDVLAGKLKATSSTNVRTRFLDLEHDGAGTDDPDDLQPDAIVSAMTLHHIADIPRFAQSLHRLLPPGGRIAIADLDTESGDFHADNTGVEHFGFDRDDLKRVFATAGFREVRVQTAYEMSRATAAGVNKTFSVFLLSARNA
jgi:cyclopropane fatty-acyl-phospholipid synthase-like methyltransferase